MPQDHIVVTEWDGRLTLRIDDWELFDFIDDHLTDNNLEYEYYAEEQVGGVFWYVLHFPSSVAPARLKRVLDLINPDEMK